MSLTHNRHLFAGISETGINHFLKLFCDTRPHVLAYGSGVYAVNPLQVTPVDVSGLAPYVSGIQFLIRFQTPVADITPAQSGSEPLPPGPDQFTLAMKGEIRLLCGAGRRGQDGDHGAHEIVAPIGVAVLCAPNVIDSSPGTGSIGITVVRVQVSGIGPNPIEQMLECILASVLRWAFSQVRIPFTVFTVGGVSLTLQEGPLAADNEIEVRGDIT